MYELYLTLVRQVQVGEILHNEVCVVLANPILHHATQLTRLILLQVPITFILQHTITAKQDA